MENKLIFLYEVINFKEMKKCMPSKKYIINK